MSKKVHWAPRSTCKAPSAFDYDDNQVFSVTGRGIYNEVSEDVDPRVSMLFGQEVLRRHLRRPGHGLVPGTRTRVKWATRRWTSFTSAPTPTTSAPPPRPDPAAVLYADGLDARRLRARRRVRVAPRPPIAAPAIRAPATWPRSSTVYNRTNPAIRDAAGNLVPGGGAFHPRLPRYVNSEQDTERAGGSLSLSVAAQREHHALESTACSRATSRSAATTTSSVSRSAAISATTASR